MLHPGGVDLRDALHVKRKDETGSFCGRDIVFARNEVLLDLLGVGFGKYCVDVERIAKFGVQKLVTFARSNFLNQIRICLVFGQVVQVTMSFVNEVKGFLCKGALKQSKI